MAKISGVSLVFSSPEIPVSGIKGILNDEPFFLISLPYLPEILSIENVSPKIIDPLIRSAFILKILSWATLLIKHHSIERVYIVLQEEPNGYAKITNEVLALFNHLSIKIIGYTKNDSWSTFVCDSRIYRFEWQFEQNIYINCSDWRKYKIRLIKNEYIIALPGSAIAIAEGYYRKLIIHLISYWMKQHFSSTPRMSVINHGSEKDGFDCAGHRSYYGFKEINHSRSMGQHRRKLEHAIKALHKAVGYKTPIDGYFLDMVFDEENPYTGPIEWHKLSKDGKHLERTYEKDSFYDLREFYQAA